MANNNENSENSTSYQNDKKLLNISVWANRLSWVILFPYTINFLAWGGFWFEELFHENGDGNYHYYFAKIAHSADVWATPVIGIIYFLILQTISSGVRMLTNLDDNGLELIRALNSKRKKSMSYIPLLAKWSSWIILSLYTIYSLATVVLYFPEFQQILQEIQSGNNDYHYYLNEIIVSFNLYVTPVMGIVYFLILQAISNGILVFQEKTS
jgi:magnesium-transporting ATPase (P-type)